MRFKYKKVKISEINFADASFKICDGDVSALLVKSIAALGVLNPPALLSKANRYCILSGFARVRACKELGMSEILSCIVEKDTPLKECVQFAVAEKAFKGDLNTVELARAIQLLNDVYEDPDELLTTAQHMGLPVNQKMIRKLSFVSRMPDTLQKGLSSGAIALPVALQLNKIEEKSVLDELCRLFVELNLSLNRQRVLLDWLIAISKREKFGINQILAENPLKVIREKPDMDRRQKTMEIWDYLHKRRWPSITSFESRYSALLKKLKLKKGARLVAPANFEGSIYSIQIDFQNINELNEMAEEVHRIVQSPHITRILEQFKSKS